MLNSRHSFIRIHVKLVSCFHVKFCQIPELFYVKFKSSYYLFSYQILRIVSDCVKFVTYIHINSC
jgi:hypothetical protein